METEIIIDHQLVEFISLIANAYPNRDQIMFICIGSDRSTGDAFGPLVGSMLKEQGWNRVIGTLEQPCDAYAVEAAARELTEAAEAEDAVIIAIDACLAKTIPPGGFIMKEGPLQPGAATGRRLPSIGRFSIAGVVNSHGPKAYAMLQTASLYQVMRMARQTAQAIQAAWP